jgi:Toprim-like
MSLIADTLLTYLPGKRKHTPSGWIGFNAVCCDDKRQRGGFIVNGGDAVSYHCFNCGFKCSWQPGRHISQKMNKFMRDLNIPDDVIAQLRLEALKLDTNNTTEVRSIIPKFDARALPIDSVPITDLLHNPPDKLIPILEYMVSRRLFPQDYPFYWTPKIGFSNRLTIPFLYKGEIVGWTARAVNDAQPKYLSEQQPGYVFNLDNQQSPPWEQEDKEFVIVSEGPFDALSIDGCALLGAEIKDSQNWLLKQLGKEIVLVPDRDEAGKATAEQAIELGWSVSMPDWPDGVKDINDAVIKLGRLATLWLIVSAKESNTLKIQLRAKKWFKEKE